jgi:predicted nucleic acid-binding protein
VKLAADANFLLSAVLGGRARDVLEHAEVEEVVTTETTLEEVQEYAAELARKKRLALDLVLLATAALPVRVIAREVYQSEIPEAERQIARRDPDDVDLLALALHLGIPVWSNDKDFEDGRVERYTTSQLLKRLRIA